MQVLGGPLLLLLLLAIALQGAAQTTTAVVGFDRQSYTVREGASQVSVCVVIRAGRIEQPAQVAIGVESTRFRGPESAQAGEDYRHRRTVISLSDSSPRRCIGIQIVDDDLIEGNQQFNVVLQVVSSPHKTTLRLSPDTATVTIQDNDIQVGFEQESYTVLEQEGAVEVCVEVTGGEVLRRGQALFLSVSTQPDTAGVEDFQPVTDLTLGPFGRDGFAIECFSVDILNDFAIEDNETFSLFLSLQALNGPPLAVSIQPRQATITILDDDDCPAFSQWRAVPGTERSIDRIICRSGTALTRVRTRPTSGLAKCQPANQTALFCNPDLADRFIATLNLGGSGMDLSSTDESEDSNETRSRRQTVEPRCPRDGEEICSDIDGIQLPYEIEDLSCLANPLQGTQRGDCKSQSLLFVLDTSGSIGSLEFARTTNAISKVIPYMCNKIQVAVMTFDSTMELEFCFNCYDNSDRTGIQDAIKNIQYRGGGTRTSSAIRCVYQDLLTTGCGLMQQDGCIDVIFLTDGQSNNRPRVCEQVECLRNHPEYSARMQLYAIGITDGVNTDEIECIAGVDSDGVNDQSIFSIRSFIEFETALNEAVNRVTADKEFICFDANNHNTDRFLGKTFIEEIKPE